MRSGQSFSFSTTRESLVVYLNLFQRYKSNISFYKIVYLKISFLKMYLFLYKPFLVEFQEIPEVYKLFFTISL